MPMVVMSEHHEIFSCSSRLFVRQHALTKTRASWAWLAVTGVTFVLQYLWNLSSTCTSRSASYASCQYILVQLGIKLMQGPTVGIRQV